MNSGERGGGFTHEKKKPVNIKFENQKTKLWLLRRENFPAEKGITEPKEERIDGRDGGKD